MKIKTETFQCSYCSKTKPVEKDGAYCVDLVNEQLRVKCDECGEEKWENICHFIDMHELAVKYIANKSNGEYGSRGYVCDFGGEGWVVMMQHKDNKLYDKIFIPEDEVVSVITKQLKIGSNYTD